MRLLILLAVLLAAPASAQTNIVDAVSAGDTLRVAALLADGALPYAADNDGTSLLEIAADSGDAAMVRLLLSAGDGWEEELDDLRGTYPDLLSGPDGALLVAAQHGDAPAVTRLLESGADPNHTTVERGYAGAVNTTPLLAAARPAAAPATLGPDYDPAEVTRLLIAAGADPNLFGSSGDESFTPLHEAAENGLAEVVSVLLANGADAALLTGVEMSSLEPRTALQVARDQRAEVEQLTFPPEFDLHRPTVAELDAVIALLNR